MCALLLALAGAFLVVTAFTGASRAPGAGPAAAPASSPDPSPGDSPEPSAQASPGRAKTQAASRRAHATPSSSRRKAGGVRDLVMGPVLPQSRPVRIDIPRIGVSSPLIGLGLDSHGAMEVPQDPAVAGWYTLGPTPGALGPAVIAGHVSWNQVPGVFYDLGSVRPGDRVQVSREDGTTATFAVTRVATFPKTRFPTRAVYGRTNQAALRLITCGGDYDATAHRFLHNVVAFARLVRS